MNAWLTIIAAIVCEVVGTSNLKLSNGFSEHLPFALVVVFEAASSFYLLSLVLIEIDVGVAYAVWLRLATALIAALGVIVFKNPVSLERVFWLI